MTMNDRITPRSLTIVAYVLFFGAVFAAPLFLSGFWTNRLATYLVYSICAVSVAMSWGYAGILSLGQGLFFGMGAYMMAMSLTLAMPSNNPVPELMLLNMEPDAVRDLCCITPGSFLWIPFRWIGTGIVAAVVIPVLLSAGIGYVMFKRRTTGVYVSIITLAFALIGQLLITNNQPLTGGFNGLANLALLEIGGIEFDPYGPAAYYLVSVTLLVVILLARYVLSGRVGQVLKAITTDDVITPLRKVAPDVPPELARCVTRMPRRDRRARPGLDEVRAVLVAAAEGRPASTGARRATIGLACGVAGAAAIFFGSRAPEVARPRANAVLVHASASVVYADAPLRAPSKAPPAAEVGTVGAPTASASVASPAPVVDAGARPEPSATGIILSHDRR